MEIILVFARLDGRILGDDSSARARRVKQAAIKALLNVGDFAAVVGANDGVRHTHSMQVAHDRATPAGAKKSGRKPFAGWLAPVAPRAK